VVSVQRLWELTRFFYNQRVVGFSVRDEPWFDDASSGKFRSLLGQAGSYIEYGAGGSTVLADRIDVPTVTIEGDPFFAQAVRKKIRPEGPVRLLVANIGTTVEWGAPMFKRLTPTRRARWLGYVDAAYDALRSLKRPLPDLVLVDGRMRRACALEAVRRAQESNHSTTVCFDDYTPREHYKDVEAWLGRPMTVGRMAIFRSEDSVRPVAREDVIEAACDWR
jgi:CheY-like chemotaxis protein